MNGKGSGRRPEERKGAYGDGWERIWGNVKNDFRKSESGSRAFPGVGKCEILKPGDYDEYDFNEEEGCGEGVRGVEVSD